MGGRFRLLRQRQGLLPIWEVLMRRASRAAPPSGAANEYISFVRAKCILDFGYVRADGELARRYPLRRACAALSASVPCARGAPFCVFVFAVCAVKRVWRSLPPAPRFLFRAAVLPHRPALSADAGRRRGGDI